MPNQDTPMPFKDLVGHRSIVGLLARAISRDSLPPSLILAGPAGVGKRTAAIALAQALNCQNAGSLLAPAPSRGKGGKGRARQTSGESTPVDPAVASIDACGECVVCRRIAQGTYSDVLLIEPEDTGNIKVEQVRDAIERTAYRPFEGRRRVVIVDEADAMNDHAQSALLKPLEEPRPSSSFVLITSHPDALLPTVRSRCTMLRFGRLSADEVARVLVATRRFDDKNARALAAMADGSPGVALGWKDQGFEDARDAAERVLQALAQRADVRRRLEHAKSLLGKKSSRSSERDQTALKLRALGSLVRDLQVLSSGADEQLLANADLAPALKRLASGYDRDRLVRAFAAVGESLEALEGNASPKIVADWMTLQI
jgi:DNA polymerase-3 subunit delta'